jgi:hypothetical protein
MEVQYTCYEIYFTTFKQRNFNLEPGCVDKCIQQPARSVFGKYTGKRLSYVPSLTFSSLPKKYFGWHLKTGPDLFLNVPQNSSPTFIQAHYNPLITPPRVALPYAAPTPSKLSLRAAHDTAFRAKGTVVPLRSTISAT